MDILIGFVVAGLMLLGLLGTLLPGLPGVALIYGGIFLYAVSFGIETVGRTTLIVFGIATILSFVLDYFAAAFGARRFGASKYGTIGSIAGGLIGIMILSLPGLLLGIFAGAVAGEMLLAKKDTQESFRAGYGAILGFLGGTALQLILGLSMIIVFLVRVI